MPEPNEQQRAFWNEEGARNWVEHQRGFDEMLEPFGEALLEAAGIGTGERVLDVGCGNGATTRDAAQRADQGHALGIDLSEAMVALARELAREQRVDNVHFEADDAQTRAFAPEHDIAISRFGVMFFDDPDAAFANIRAALCDDGRVTMAVWQEAAANDWMAIPCAALFEHVERPAVDPGAPGPFAMADTDRVRSILATAGFRDITIDGCTAAVLMGGHGTLDDAVRFMRSTSIGRSLLDDKPAEIQQRATDSMRAALEPFVTREGVRLTGAAWIVGARR